MIVIAIGLLIFLGFFAWYTRDLLNEIYRLEHYSKDLEADVRHLKDQVATLVLHPHSREGQGIITAWKMTRDMERAVMQGQRYTTGGLQNMVVEKKDEENATCCSDAQCRYPFGEDWTYQDPVSKTVAICPKCGLKLFL